MPPETVSPESEMDDSQDRLTRILGAVRLKKVKVDPSVTPPVEACCPRCGQRMALGTQPWCGECRYSPQLGRDVTDSEISNGLGSETPKRFRLLAERGWQFRLLTGLLLLFAISLGCREIWPNLIERAFYGRVLLVTGIVIWGIAHAWAYLVVCRLHRHGPITTLTSMSVFHPIPIWMNVFRSLPVTRNVFSLGVSGIAVVIMACTVVGIDAQDLGQDVARSWQNQKSGLLSQLTFHGTSLSAETENITPPEQPNETVSSKDSSDNDTVNKSSGHEAIPRSPEGLPRENKGEFHIFGYLMNADGEMRSVLVAQVENNRGRFVGRVPLDGTDSTVIEDLRRVLDQNRTSRPALPLSYQARWVKPVVICQVAFVGWTNSRTLKDGHLLNFSTMTIPAKLAERPKDEAPQREPLGKTE